ncbi:MAG TPA: hypothetical protein VGV17_15970 [Bosea sp. (in: a-proteobacteria)]|jgi:hypothetical protein|uniref:hypothetical protein n=1 Tax=Bosea sp. (in: a-proteobacteria) TaxID=1871050 RepID=UPI002DDD6FA2|nr:hypothetical protein [Bosea sp. (in: a-proteobacteria)]HEV2555252.1 hypothetical protein [Bosea sp. (in: a-proteobacteria)]
MSGALDAPLTMTNAESLLITLDIVDGSATPSDYDWTYALTGCQTLNLTEGDGITVDDGEGTVTIDPGAAYRLAPGEYKHGLVSTNKLTGQALQLFDGTVTVTESPNA